jgi:hypothetical protein
MSKHEKTEFKGEITIVPVLNDREILFLKKFSEMKHVKRHNGPYFVEDLIIETLNESNTEVAKELEELKPKKKTRKNKEKELDTEAKKEKKKPTQALAKTENYDKYSLHMEMRRYPTDGSDVIDHNRPHDGKPGLWCRWTVNAEGSAIIWNGHEDFYNASDWMAYLINHFIGTQPMARGATTLTFLNTHTLNGVIEGIEDGEKIRITVKDNIVKTDYL